MLKVQELAVSALKPWEHNPRLNDHAVDAVAKSIKSFGFNVPILCDKDSTIIAGHTRWKAAKKLGMKAVPVIALEMSGAQRRAFSVADNKTAELADWNLPQLREILDELRCEDIDLVNMGFSDEDLRSILKDTAWGEDEIPDLSEESQVEVGDMFQLGRHRLLCGDSRNRNNVDLLTEGKKMDMVFAGPPCFNQRLYAHWDHYQDYNSDMQRVITNSRNLLQAGGVLVWHVANDSSSNHDLTSHHSRLLEEAGLMYLDTIAWIKTRANYSTQRNAHIRRSRCYYPAFQWEAILVFRDPNGKMPKMTREAVEYMSGHHTNVWEVSSIMNQIETYGHPAVSPVEIPYRCLQAYTGADANIFEPFGGSGTTLIAAEKGGRRAFVLEQIPAYCDRIIKRWEAMAGRKAELLDK
jgi:site-specific DNA-methyltransferase (adenine-specific)